MFATRCCCPEFVYISFTPAFDASSSFASDCQSPNSFPLFIFLRPPSCFYLTGFAHDPVAKKVHTHTNTRKKEKTFFRVGRVSRVKRRRRRLKTGLGAEDLFCLRVFEKKRKKPTRIFSRVAHPWNCVHKNVRPISSFLKPFSIMTLVPDSFFFSVCPFFFLLCLFCLFSWALILGSFSLMVSSS